MLSYYPVSPAHPQTQRYPSTCFSFLIWTMQRTGGTSLTDLADHKPFNRDRQFAAVKAHLGARGRAAEKLAELLAQLISLYHTWLTRAKLEPWPGFHLIGDPRRRSVSRRCVREHAANRPRRRDCSRCRIDGDELRTGGAPDYARVI
jgi:hypothetical protein